MVIFHSYVSLPDISQTIQTMMLEPARETYVKTCDTTGTVSDVSLAILILLICQSTVAQWV